MGQETVATATLQCTFGAAPSVFSVLPKSRTLCGGMPAANIMDNTPMMNIMPFGVCSSLSNPTVASATSAALGVLTPMRGRDSNDRRSDSGSRAFSHWTELE